MNSKNHIVILILFLFVSKLSVYSNEATNSEYFQEKESFETSESDSLALVALFNHNGGENWQSHQNWLEGPLDTWENVTVESGRVVALSLYSYPDKFGLSGELTSEITNLTALKELRLSNNALTGSLPENIGEMLSLEILIIGDNQLSGEIPSSIGNLKKLTILLLSWNNLSGNIPATIGGLESLRTLLLNGNNLSGNVPEEIVNLKFIGNIDLRNNQLSGNFPALGFGENKLLQTVTLSNNNFTGLSDLSQTFGIPVTFWVENNYLSFEDLEPYAQMNFSNGFNYLPQNQISADTTLQYIIGENVEIDPEIGGTQNHYTWYKDGELLNTTAAVLSFPGVSSENSGSYHCQVTNDLLPGLTIRSKNFILQVFSEEPDWLTHDADAFELYYENQNIPVEELSQLLNEKLEDLDHFFYNPRHSVFRGHAMLPLLSLESKIKVYVCDNEFPYSPSSYQDWDIGYYNAATNSIYVKQPSEAQQVYYPSVKEACVAVLARYVVELKSKMFFSDLTFDSPWAQVGIGLFESGYEGDISLIKPYLLQNGGAFPDFSVFNSWEKLAEPIHVELAFALMQAAILRDGGYNVIPLATSDEGEVYDYYNYLIRYLVLEDEGEGKLTRYYSDDDVVVYSFSDEGAQAAANAYKELADEIYTDIGARIKHPLYILSFKDHEDYTLAQRGNLDEMDNGGFAISHNYSWICDEDGARGLVRHECSHNVFAYITEGDSYSVPWLNEGMACHYGGQTNLSGNNIEYFHEVFWNREQEYWPQLDSIFIENDNFGYRMARYSYEFLLESKGQEIICDFIKELDDFSILGYTDIDELSRHTYETAYFRLMPSFIFDPDWNDNAIASGSDFVFKWESHYVKNFVVSYSIDKGVTWHSIDTVDSETNQLGWRIPATENLAIKFADLDFPEISFPYVIYGTVSVDSHLEENNIKIFPNPSNGQFFISNTQNIQKIRISTIDGKEVYYREKSVDDKIPIQLDVMGIYVIQLETINGEKINRKIIVN